MSCNLNHIKVNALGKCQILIRIFHYLEPLGSYVAIGVGNYTNEHITYVCSFEGEFFSDCDADFSLSTIATFNSVSMLAYMYAS